jgi:hypothetical protein
VFGFNSFTLSKTTGCSDLCGATTSSITKFDRTVKMLRLFAEQYVNFSTPFCLVQSDAYTYYDHHSNECLSAKIILMSFIQTSINLFTVI